MKYYLLIISILICHSNVFADDHPGNRLLEFCDSAFKEEKMKNRFEGLEGDIGWKEAVKAASEGVACHAYIMGAVSSFMIANLYIEHNLKKKDKIFYCMPSAVTQDQVEKVVYKYLKDNPEKLHLPASLLVHDALIKAFPCK